MDTQFRTLLLQSGEPNLRALQNEGAILDPSEAIIAAVDEFKGLENRGGRRGAVKVLLLIYDGYPDGKPSNRDTAIGIAVAHGVLVHSIAYPPPKAFEQTISSAILGALAASTGGTCITMKAPTSSQPEIEGAVSTFEQDVRRLRVMTSTYSVPFDSSEAILKFSNDGIWPRFAKITLPVDKKRPDIDTDKDGVPDRADACPEQAEDKDGFEDQNGCPDLDNDGDRIVDKSDQCPMERENLNEYEDEDGCPDIVPTQRAASTDYTWLYYILGSLLLVIIGVTLKLVWTKLIKKPDPPFPPIVVDDGPDDVARRTAVDSPAPSPSIVAVSGDDAPGRFPLEAAGRSEFGRSPDLGVRQLKDPYVSNLHFALIRNDRGGWSFQLSDSANHENETWVDGIKIQHHNEVEVFHQCEIHIAPTSDGSAFPRYRLEDPQKGSTRVRYTRDKPTRVRRLEPEPPAPKQVRPGATLVRREEGPDAGGSGPGDRPLDPPHKT